MYVLHYLPTHLSVAEWLVMFARYVNVFLREDLMVEVDALHQRSNKHSEQSIFELKQKGN